MKNIELKARCPDPERSRGIARSLAAAPRGIIQQTDTYFRVPAGRLKLREMDRAELIFYRRSDESGVRESDYDVVPVADPAALKRTLDRALGVWRVVSKRRELWMLDNVRIHLDQVDGLGSFIEFEAVIDDAHSEEECRRAVARLSAAFGIREEDRIGRSYSDLM